MRTATVKRPRPAEQTARTKTEAQMRATLGSFDEGTERHQVLACAIGFKRSWLELAAHLARVQNGGTFKEWGYRTFEAYAQKELHLRRETAEKLTRAHRFIESNEPTLLDARSKRPLPMFEAVDALAIARADQHLSERDYRELRDRVFGDELTPAQVRKLFREKVPPAPMTPVTPEDRLRKCLQLAERLHGMLLEDHNVDVADIAAHHERTVKRLRRVLEV